jgi:hypothetical protein
MEVFGMNTEKYQRAYFLPPQMSYDWVKKDYIDKAPIWCSVDLRDGNQALIVPMNLDEKLDGSDENVHKECVKVYRNVQAAVVEENEKQTEAIAGKIKESLNGKLNGVLGVSIAALLVAAADIVLHVLSILHIF